MKRLLLGLGAILLFCSHDMFLKMDDYFLEPQTQSVIQLFNGTFDKSENVIDRNRMLDVSLVGNGNRIAVDTSQWFERDSITFLNFKTGDPGTWVSGVSTAARNIELAAQSFNDYLEHDGVLDMLEQRKKNGILDQDAVEKYSKHVKTIFQVGEERSNDWGTVLGYPIEFVPLENPYDVHAGHSLKVRLLSQGKPLTNQLVYVGVAENRSPGQEMHAHGEGEPHSHGAQEAHSHGDETSHTHTGEEHDHTHTNNQQLRTDQDGVVEVDITANGVWHLRTIHMVHREEEGLTHESNWATLTFAVGAGHAHDETTHTHEDDSHSHEEEGFSVYFFGIASLVVLVLLFFWFNRKK